MSVPAPFSAFPVLGIHPESGLTFAWSEMVHNESLSELSCGADGVALGMVMLIYFDDLQDALQQLLGYSYRAGAGDLQRNLPFQHPYFNQLWCTRIDRCQFLQSTGNETWVDPTGSGTISTWTFAKLGLKFTRPNYPLLEDSDIEEGEWERFTDRYWKPKIDILSRPDGMFKFEEGTDVPTGRGIIGSVGQRLGKAELQRTWYQIPEAGVYNANSFPEHLFLLDDGTPRLGTVNDAEFLGCATGTLLYMAPDIVPIPLQMPGYLMGIAGESVQLQYNIRFNFIYFDPPIGPGTTKRGHNNMPWSKNNLWYPVISQSTPPKPPFASSDFTQLFTIM